MLSRGNGRDVFVGSGSAQSYFSLLCLAKVRIVSNYLDNRFVTLSPSTRCYPFTRAWRVYLTYSASYLLVGPLYLHPITVLGTILIVLHTSKCLQLEQPRSTLLQMNQLLVLKHQRRDSSNQSLKVPRLPLLTGVTRSGTVYTIDQLELLRGIFTSDITLS